VRGQRGELVGDLVQPVLVGLLAVAGLHAAGIDLDRIGGQRLEGPVELEEEVDDLLALLLVLPQHVVPPLLVAGIGLLRRAGQAASAHGIKRRL
jgi:hypothetical protein